MARRASSMDTNSPAKAGEFRAYVGEIICHMMSKPHLEGSTISGSSVLFYGMLLPADPQKAPKLRSGDDSLLVTDTPPCFSCLPSRRAEGQAHLDRPAGVLAVARSESPRISQGGNCSGRAQAHIYAQIRFYLHFSAFAWETINLQLAQA